MCDSIFSIVHLDDDVLELRKFSRNLKHNAEKFNKTQKTASSLNFQIHSFESSKKFLSFVLSEAKIHICVLDIELSQEEEGDGFALIKQIKQRHPSCGVIMSSWHDDTLSILKALSLSADDFLSKSSQHSDIVDRFLHVYHNLQIKTGHHAHILPSHRSIITSDKTMLFEAFAGTTLQNIEKRVPNILKSAVKCVLIEGESGTGKEVVADIFENYMGPRVPFIRINCGALAHNLLESELFGHKKGSFTGALENKTGFIESADNGILFLDEVSSLSLAAQILLLRTIETQEIRRVGEVKSRKINVRFLFASNVPLQELVQKNQFRNDLWQRMREIELSLPPLYKRKSEIPDIIDYFCKKLLTKPLEIDPLAKKILCQYDWRLGNIRELRNTLRAMSEFTRSGILGIDSLPERLITQLQNKTFTEESNDNNQVSLTFFSKKSNRNKTYAELCTEILKIIIQQKKLTSKNINISKLAKELEISRTTLMTKLKMINNDSKLNII